MSRPPLPVLTRRRRGGRIARLGLVALLGLLAPLGADEAVAFAGDGPVPTVATAAPAVAPGTAAHGGAATGAPGAKGSAPAKRVAVKPAGSLLRELLPIGILILVIALVVRRLPRIDLGHAPAFLRRRAFNWLPLGLTYAFLYMGRYNLTAFKDAGGLTVQEFGTVFGVGSAVYGLSFLLNGPLTDRWGGRATILISALGSACANLLMGLAFLTGRHVGSPVLTYALLYGANMYFQSFGAVSIVKVNAAWFHVRERGTFGGIFGILISLGLYFAYDWGYRIARAFALEWVFFVPAAILVLFFGLSAIWVRDNPSETGHPDFDPGDASSGDHGPRLAPGAVIKSMMTNPVILTISLIELCSGFLRQAILQWYRDFARGVGLADSFVYANWGMVSCIAGITGGVFAGLISDHVFQARRGPVAAVLYGLMLVGAIAILPLMAAPMGISWVIAVMSMAIIGVHGMLSGTASQDFGGKKNAGVAVGIIDGFVYLGSMAQSFLYGNLLPAKDSPASKLVENWHSWPLAMIPAALIGLLLATRVWNARAKGAAKR